MPFLTAHRSACVVQVRRARVVTRCEAPAGGPVTKSKPEQKQDRGIGGLGDVLGPIGLTIGQVDTKVANAQTISSGLRCNSNNSSAVERLADQAGVSLGPIALSFAEDRTSSNGAASTSGNSTEMPELQRPQSIARMSTEEWRALYEKNGTVDLWVEEEFNAGSRLVGGRAVHHGGVYGYRTGEGPSAGSAVKHTVKIFNHYADQVVEVEVPEDRYVLWEAEDKGLELPYACRMGCCTACAVKVVEGELYQPQALGISEELKQQGYALMCVGFPRSDCVLQTVEEDEVYDLQFGRYFEQYATDPNAPSIERDDFALEFANMDE